MRRGSGKVTIVEVAAEAGVSFGTVSRVINNDVHVKPETRERVLATMRRLNFVANRQARSLAGGRSNTIGVLVPDLGTGYIGEIMRGIDTELALAGYDLVLYTTHRVADKEAEYVSSLARGVVDGLLIVLPRNPEDYAESLIEQRYPFALIDHQGTGKSCPTVTAANWQGGFNAVEYLIGLGHRRIGLITGSLDLVSAVDRMDGYKMALRANHVVLDPNLIYEGTYNLPDGYDGAKQMLELPDPPTAIFAENDVMAMAAIDAVREKGLKVPEDISVVGFDDIPQASLIRPALTTVRQPLEQMGRIAAQITLEMIHSPESERHQIELPTEMMVRGSTAHRGGARI